MKKLDYQRCKSVQEFAAWMAQKLRDDSVMPHRYTLARTGEDVAFSNLVGAFHSYYWPFREKPGDQARHTFAENAAALGGMRDRLRAALAAGDKDAVLAECLGVMYWGGVSNGNDPWLRANADSLVDQLRATSALLSGDHDNQFASLKMRLRFNAGMTKVYSLINDGFIIYDSRVAAALAWLVLTWIYETKPGEFPEELMFACMSPKEAINATIKKCRNPGDGAFIFGAMNNNHKRHAQWNMRANWLLELVLAGVPAGSSPFGGGADAPRKLESALFMWGYDLSQNLPRQPLAKAA